MMPAGPGWRSSGGERASLGGTKTVGYDVSQVGPLDWYLVNATNAVGP